MNAVNAKDSIKRSLYMHIVQSFYTYIMIFIRELIDAYSLT